MREREKVELFERVIAAWGGHDGYLTFATSWRETMGPTQLELADSEELDDSRLFVVVRQTATGPQSGVDVELLHAQILEFEGDKASRSELFGDRDEGRATAGLDA